MIKFINTLTNTEMLVADDRKEEYLAAGHRLAVNPVITKKAETVTEEPKKEHKAPTRRSANTKKK